MTPVVMCGSQEIAVVEVPKLGEQAATHAIMHRGKPKSKITHLVFSTSCGVDMPTADYQLTKLLVLHPSVKRYVMYQHGCYAGGSVFRLAKDLAENNKGARVLVVCSELSSVLSFHGPEETNIDSQRQKRSVGSDPLLGVEKPLFEIVSVLQTIVPDSEGVLDGHLRDAGLMSFNHSTSWIGTQFFGLCIWVALQCLDKVEEKLALEPDKLRASRRVLHEYGNMWGASVLFILNEMRHSSAIYGLQTTYAVSMYAKYDDRSGFDIRKDHKSGFNR
ncbi:hypothetical protein L1987_33406 [Smallanthus sonchifolius]|uniref:Uncharacterized protein n=1 Tax=Smallanthus sonchifolius TaxID=185202 RepID=A0ACB9HRB1_9ASTR|nr:hypothetical protein L1987_33406 [Smallanthus sonchifolius]